MKILNTLSRKLVAIQVLLLSMFFSGSILAGELSAYQFFNEKLNISLPNELKPLTPKALNKRYGKQSTPPNYAFEDSDNSVSFTFTRYSTPANKKSMNKIHKSISNMLRKASSSANWKKDKVYTRLGTKIAVYEYEVKGIGQYQYNLTYALPVDGQLTFISFITTDKKYKKKWLALARESLDSLTL